MKPGRMRKRATFQSQQMVNDGFGNYVGSWIDRCERWCNVAYLRGSETVMASRLEGRQPVILTFRQDTQTAKIIPEWRVLIDGTEYNIREPLRPSDDGLRFELLCEGGVAT